ncbi:MAG: DUF5320 domain-containing protein [Candidatus Aenigmatarchaeota archaeon]
MPRGDRTGPRGEGPATGRGLGYCTGFNSPGFAKGVPRGGAGRGGGRGRGRGAGRQSAYNPRGQLRPRFAASSIVPESRTEINDPGYESMVDKIKELEEEIGELKEELD